MRLFWWALFALFAVLAIAPRRALAQTEPKITAQIDPASIEVGEACTVTLSVTAEASSPVPTDPRLQLPPALRSSPPSVATQTQVSIVNGRFTRTSGITATWQVVPSQEGMFVVGPASVSWNGKWLLTRPLRLTVHPAGSGRARPRQRAPNPFDPFGMFPKLPGFFDRPDPFEPPPPTEPPADPELALDVAPDPKVFLRSVIDKRSAVVGEQLTLTVFVYSRVNSLEIADSHEPSIPDFFRRDLIAPHTQPDPRGVFIRGVPWRAQPVFKAALFPLRSGVLQIGPMQATFVARGLGGAEPRSTEAIDVRVSEPPAQGRPVGYQIGDVGSYTLTASVDPREVEVGSAVSVNVTLSGVGNVPTALQAPSSSSFEWLDPEVREKLDADGGKVKGTRSFVYVVRPKVAGDHDLGQITLPYWNPERRTYEVARAVLGRVRVAPGAQPSASAAAAAASAVPRDPWAALGPPRERLTAFPELPTPFTERPWYWVLLIGAPLAVVIGALGERGARRLYARTAARRASRQRGVDRALAEARAADARGATTELAGALDRALHLAIEEATELKGRAVLIAELPAALEARGVAQEVARACGELLAAIDAARFLPSQNGSLRDLRPRVESVTRELLRSARSARSARTNASSRGSGVPGAPGAPGASGGARPSRPSRAPAGAR